MKNITGIKPGPAVTNICCCVGNLSVLLRRLVLPGSWRRLGVWFFKIFLSCVSSILNKIYKLRNGLPAFLCAYLQISPDRFFTFGFGTGQLLPQHFLPHVDSLEGLLDVKEILLEYRNKEFQLTNSTYLFPCLKDNSSAFIPVVCKRLELYLLIMYHQFHFFHFLFIIEQLIKQSGFPVSSWKWVWQEFPQFRRRLCQQVCSSLISPRIPVEFRAATCFPSRLYKLRGSIQSNRVRRRAPTVRSVFWPLWFRFMVHWIQTGSKMKVILDSNKANWTIFKPNSHFPDLWSIVL